MQQPPTYDAVDQYLTAVDTALRANESKLSLQQDSLLRCTAIYVTQWWANMVPRDSKTAKQRLRALVVDKHIACVTMLLDRLGTHGGKLAAVNGALLWCAMMDADIQTTFSDTRAVTITCCLCRRSGLKPFCVSPGFWLRQRTAVPICEHCSTTIERTVPLHKSPTRCHCSACGQSLSGTQFFAHGEFDRLCTQCNGLVVVVD